MLTQTRLLAFLGLVLTNLFWASNAIVARFVEQDIPPITLSFMRWFLAFVLLLPFALPHLKGKWCEVRRQWPVIIVLGILGITMYNTVLYIAAHSTTAVNMTLVSSTLPLVTLLVVWLMLRQRPDNWQLLGIFASLAGVLMIISQGSLGQLLALEFSRGDLLMFGISCCWSIYSVILRKYPIDLHPIALLTVLTAVGMPVIFVLCLIEISQIGIVELSGQTWSIFLYVAIFPSILAYIFWGIGVKALGPNISALSCYLMPLFTALIAVPFLGEVLYSYHFVGGLLILVGLYFGVWFRAR